MYIYTEARMKLRHRERARAVDIRLVEQRGVVRSGVVSVTNGGVYVKNGALHSVWFQDGNSEIESVYIYIYIYIYISIYIHIYRYAEARIKLRDRERARAVVGCKIPRKENSSIFRFFSRPPLPASPG